MIPEKLLYALCLFLTATNFSRSAVATSVMDLFDDLSGKAGGGWGVQPSSTTGVPDTEEQTGEENLDDDMFAAFESAGGGPGGG